MKGTVQERRRFSAEEDEQLKKAVEMHGMDWEKVSSTLEYRRPRQCRERYKYFLDPNLPTQEWTPDMDLLLSKLYFQQGPKWAEFSQLLGGKTAISIKNRWLMLKRRAMFKETKTKKRKNTKTQQKASDKSSVDLTCAILEDWDESGYIIHGKPSLLLAKKGQPIRK